MSLIVIAAAAAAAIPAHSVTIDRDGAHYAVDYVAHVDTASRVVGVAAPSHAGTQSCVTRAAVTFERRITSASGKAISTMLPGEQDFTETRPGRCAYAQERGQALVAERQDAVAAHLTEVADADRPRLVDAIDAARSLAAR